MNPSNRIVDLLNPLSPHLTVRAAQLHSISLSKLFCVLCVLLYPWRRAVAQVYFSLFGFDVGSLLLLLALMELLNYSLSHTHTHTGKQTPLTLCRSHGGSAFLAA